MSSAYKFASSQKNSGWLALRTLLSSEQNHSAWFVFSFDFVSCEFRNPFCESSYISHERHRLLHYFSKVRRAPSHPRGTLSMIAQVCLLSAVSSSIGSDSYSRCRGSSACICGSGQEDTTVPCSKPCKLSSLKPQMLYPKKVSRVILLGESI